MNLMMHRELFRGTAKGIIRKTIIDKNYLDAVIGFPANIFYGTGIATTIVAFKSGR